MLHELTNKIHNLGVEAHTSDVDSLIREWLEEKADEILDKTSGSDFMKEKIYKPLGLSEPKKASEESWCEHKEHLFNYDSWLFCPWCGATCPRPQPKSLREKLYDAFMAKDYGENHSNKLADTAIKILSEDGKK